MDHFKDILEMLSLQALYFSMEMRMIRTGRNTDIAHFTL